MLVQTSMANRTSPVLRGKWVMEVLLGTPPPPPPPDVPDLEASGEAKEGRLLTTRERMEIHRANPTCNSCHRFMDPIGLSLDNFDVTGRWRAREYGSPLDTSGDFYDGTPVSSASELVHALLKRPIPLVRTFTENLMAYALGRRVEYYDQPTIRAIARKAQADDYRLSSFILGIVKSDAFRLTQAEAAVTTDDARGVGRPLTRRVEETDDDVLHHRKAHAPPHVPPRRRRHRGAAVPGRDGAGRPGAGRGAGRRAHPPGVHRGSARAGRLQQLGGGQVPVRAGADRSELLAGAGQSAERARGVSRLHDHHQQHRRAQCRGLCAAGNWRRPLPLQRRVPDPVAPEADAGLGHLGRHLARPDVRQALRPGDAAAVDAVLHREPRPGRRLHLQLLVRLHRLDQLGVAERAAADDSRSARGVRHAVRGRHHGGGPPGAAGEPPRHPRLDRRRGEQHAARSGRRRSRAAGPLSRERAGARAPHQGGRSAQHRAASRATCRTRRPACPTRSPST